MFEELTRIVIAYKDVFSTLLSDEDYWDLSKVIEEWKYNMIAQFRMLYSYRYLKKKEFIALWQMLIAIQEEFS